MMEELVNYIRAFINLYDMIHKDKVIEIYNQQNSKKIDKVYLEKFMERKGDILLNKYYIKIHNDYFVCISILVTGTFSEELDAREGKPYYVPDKEELLQYKNNGYFVKNKEYEKLYRFLRKKYWDKSKVEEMMEDIHTYCKSTRLLEKFPDLLSRYDIDFGDEEEKFFSLVMDLHYNTRVKQHNGFTPIELGLTVFD